MDEIIKKYSNGTVTVVWQPAKCIHSMICWKPPFGLPEVFDPKARPWVDMEGASDEKIIAQVKKCPSGALSYFLDESPEQPVDSGQETSEGPPVVVQVMEGGPLMVYGNLTVRDPQGNEVARNNVTAFCRCGGSKNHPYCDGSHAALHFEG